MRGLAEPVRAALGGGGSGESGRGARWRMATWYYVAGGEQRGPLDDGAFLQLVSQGTIQAETLVWNETLTDWQPYGRLQASLVERQAEALATGSQAAEAGEGPAPLRTADRAATVEAGEPAAAAPEREEAPAPLRPVSPEPAATAAEASAATTPPAPETALAAPLAAGPAPAAAPAVTAGVRCGECGLPFPQDEVVPIAGQWVCAGCKPLALQKLREGVGLRGTMAFAGFWIRVAARLVDGLILMVPSLMAVMVLWGAVGVMAFSRSGSSSLSVLPALVVMGVVFVVMSVLPFAYTVFFVGRYGATPGKMACGLLVVRADGSRLTYARAAGRALADLLNGFTLNIGYVIAAFDAEKRALHDHICDTRVIYK